MWVVLIRLLNQAEPLLGSVELPLFACVEGAGDGGCTDGFGAVEFERQNIV